MGMIMNRFNMLTQIREDIKNGNTGDFNYNRFVLSGIIVHDTNDRKLTSCIRKNFVKWAEMTGDHFLFITFVRPSIDWKNSKYCNDSYWIDKNTLMADSKYAEDEKRTIPLLRDFLDLPKEGSFLMVTNNLSSNDFHKIPITSKTIESQLQLLTEYCNEEASGKEHSPAEYKRLLKILNADDYEINASLLDILIDFTSISSKLADKFYHEDQLFHADKVIDKLRYNLKKYEGSDFEDRLFHLYEAMEIVYTKIKNSRNPHLRPDLQNLSYYKPMLEQYMDDYSKKLFRTYSLLSSMFGYQAEPLDYSGLTIYLGKIVENELHLSIGQMLRWSMGISMPKYFNKYCRQRRNVIVPAGKQKVNLNKSASGGGTRQKGIPMGTLLVAYDTMFNHPNIITPKPDSEKLQKLDDNLLSFLNHFCSNYRNPAGHLDPNSEITYRGAKNAFNTFLAVFLIKLYEIRIRLSTRNENNR